MTEISGQMTPEVSGRYYYHPDHLGSSSTVTDRNGRFHEQLEYFPYGETWVHSRADVNGESIPYRFTSRELDAETGLYYYGARYYDSQMGLWISADPAIADSKYFPEPNDFDTEHDYYWYAANVDVRKLPGMGGVYNSINLNAYHYAGLNPVLMKDPDGDVVFIVPIIIGAILGAGGGAAVEAGTQVLEDMALNDKSFEDAVADIDWKDVGISAGVSAVLGGAGLGVVKNTAKAGKAIKRFNETREKANAFKAKAFNPKKDPEKISVKTKRRVNKKDNFVKKKAKDAAKALGKAAGVGVGGKGLKDLGKDILNSKKDNSQNEKK